MEILYGYFIAKVAHGFWYQFLTIHHVINTVGMFVPHTCDVRCSFVCLIKRFRFVGVSVLTENDPQFTEILIDCISFY